MVLSTLFFCKRARPDAFEAVVERETRTSSYVINGEVLTPAFVNTAQRSVLRQLKTFQAEDPVGAAVFFPNDVVRKIPYNSKTGKV